MTADEYREGLYRLHDHLEAGLREIERLGLAETDPIRVLAWDAHDRLERRVVFHQAQQPEETIA